jgi:hypothetical protein
MTGPMVARGAALALLFAAPAVATVKRVMGELWAYPQLFQQALSPLADLAGRVVREGSCPNLSPGADGVIHSYEFEAKFRARGTSNRRYEVTELRTLNPTGCAWLDAEMTRFMTAAIPEFAEPRTDVDGNGWYRIPRIMLRVSD